jgi:hypothetical protein
MSDADRALAHRRTPPRGVEIDDEVTPPPQEPPRAASIEDLAAVVAELTRWVQPMAPLRHDVGQLGRVDHKLDTLLATVAQQGVVQETFIMPALKSTMGSVDLLLSHYEANKIRQAHFYDREWPAAAKKIDDLGERIGRVERAVEKASDRQEASDERVAEVGRRTHGNSERLKAIETNARVEAGVQQALTNKQKAAVGGVASVLGALAGWLSQYL